MPKFYCFNCSQHIDANESLAGTMAECPSCKIRLSVPSGLPTTTVTLTANPYSPPYSNPPSSLPTLQDATRAVPASFGIRLGAHILDVIVTYILAFIVGFMIGATLGGTTPADTIQGFAAISGIASSWLYYALMESSSKQATLGKMACGLFVTNLQGQRIGFGQASGRYFGMFVSAFTLLIGFLMCAWTEKKQCLHDMMAGCLVLTARGFVPPIPSGALMGNQDQLSGSIPQRPKPLSIHELADTIKTQCVSFLGIHPHQMDSLILQDLRVPPGNLETLFDDLEYQYGISISPEVRRRLYSVSDIIQFVQNAKTEDSEQDATSNGG